MGLRRSLTLLFGPRKGRSYVMSRPAVSFRSAWTVLFVISAAGAFVRPAAGGTSAKLAPSAKVGETLRYRVTSRFEASDTIALPKTRVDLDAIYTQRVISVSKGGVVTLEVRPSEGSVIEEGGSSMGNRVDAKTAPKFSAEMTKSGALVEFRGLLRERHVVGVYGTVDLAPLYNWFVGFSGFPDRDVQPGDSWGRSAAVSFAGAGKFQVGSSAKLLRFETIRHRQCAVIESEVTLPVGKMRPPSRQAGISSRASGDLHISTTNYVDLADGTLLRSEGRFTSKEAYAVTFGTGSRAAKSLSGATELNGSIHVALDPSGR
jgi:hypothetical protein